MKTSMLKRETYTILNELREGYATCNSLYPVGRSRPLVVKMSTTILLSRLHEGMTIAKECNAKTCKWRMK